MPALIVGHASGHCKRPRNQLRRGPASRVCYKNMHARVTPAVVPSLRSVMWAIPVFLFLIGLFHRADPA
jgi:hypothetical protein